MIVRKCALFAVASFHPIPFQPSTLHLAALDCAPCVTLQVACYKICNVRVGGPPSSGGRSVKSIANPPHNPVEPPSPDEAQVQAHNPIEAELLQNSKTKLLHSSQVEPLNPGEGVLVNPRERKEATKDNLLLEMNEHETVRLRNTPDDIAKHIYY